MDLSAELTKLPAQPLAAKPGIRRKTRQRIQLPIAAISQAYGEKPGMLRPKRGLAIRAISRSGTLCSEKARLTSVGCRQVCYPSLVRRPVAQIGKHHYRFLFATNRLNCGPVVDSFPYSTNIFFHNDL